MICCIERGGGLSYTCTSGKTGGTKKGGEGGVGEVDVE